jgi:DNA-binding FadR family transcriptional regulator
MLQNGRLPTKKNAVSFKKPNLKSRVYERLMNMVIDGKYQDNEMLPPERLLCEEFGVSRTVVREAVNSLETRGILQVVHGKGVKVVPPTSDDISDAFMLYLRRQRREVSLKDLMGARFAIEPEIARCAALNATRSELKKVEGILKRAKAALEDLDNYVSVDLEFHLQLAYMTHNIVFITILESLLIPLRRSFTETVDVRDNRVTFKEHMEIFKKVQAREAMQAKAVAEKHLKHVRSVLQAHGKL